VHHQRGRLSYKTFQKEVNKLAMGLLALSIKTGERVGI
jgi:fatty-acyl-CoA synthase